MVDRHSQVSATVALGIAAIVFIGFTPASNDLGHPQAGRFAVGDFTEPRVCGMCHPTQHGQWEGTLHNHSTDDPFYLRVLRMAREELPGVEDSCSSCHSPVAELTGQDPLEPESLVGTAQFGLSCDFCHTVAGFDHLGNAGFTSSPGEVKYGPFGSEPPIYHKVQHSPLHDSAEFCGTCHDVSHPLNGLTLESTYTEFIDGPYPAEGYKCQTCHMTPGLTQFEPFPGASANGAEERPHIWTHWFVGANAFMLELMGEEELAAIARERLRRAATIEISRIDAGAGQRYFEVTVTNSGCGHSLPTGVTEERQIWLEVEVFDAEENALAHFGKLDEHGAIPDDTMILMTTFGDAEGEPTHKIWFAEQVLSDRRIPPRGSRSQAYHLSVVDSPEPALIRARLWYRSSHQEFIDLVFADAEERVIVPNVLMAETERRF